MSEYLQIRYLLSIFAYNLMINLINNCKTMTVFNRFLILLGLFISFNLNAFCQEDDDDANDKIVEQLRQKYT